MNIKLCIFLAQCFALLVSCTPDNRNVSGLLGQENSVWSESIYLRGYNPTTKEELTDKHIQRYAATLKKNNIKYAYLFAGPYGNDGRLPDYAFSNTAIRTVQALKDLYPELIVLPWIGGLQNKTIHLEDSSWVNAAIKDTKKLIATLKVPGVHVDMEYLLGTEAALNYLADNSRSGVDDYGKNANEFHRKLRNELPDAFISSVVVANLPDTRPWKRKTSRSELNALTGYVDQISFLYFDTSIDNQETFDANCKKLIQDIKTLKRQNDIQYLIAIGTFINEPQLQHYRNMEIENIPNTISTIKHNLFLVDSSKTIIGGIGIYCDWQTGEREWEQIRDSWTRIN